VTISAPCYSTMPVGRKLYVCGRLAMSRRGEWARFEDYTARLALSRSTNGAAGNVGVTVRPPDGALLELLQNGSVHESLVEEPQAA
jgi:hypothetical protein